MLSVVQVAADARYGERVVVLAVEESLCFYP